VAFGAAQAPAQDLTKLATDLAAKIQAAKHSRVTVVDFLDLDKKTTKLGKHLAYQLQAALAEPGLNLDVVDQSHLAELFDQMELLSEGLIDPATGRELGKIAGTEVLVVGTVMISSLSVRLDVKAIDLQTAKMIAAGTANPKRFGLLDRLASDAEGADSTADADEEEEASAPPGKGSPGKSGKAPPRSKRDLGVLFALDGCSLNGDELTCSVTVTSDRDRWFALTLESRAWNDTGDEHGPREVTIANTRSGRSCAAKQLLRDLPTPLSLTFPQFGEEATNVERIRLAWYEADDCCCYNTRPVDFEKIALSDAADFSSPQTAGRSAGGKGDKTAGSGKKSGSLFKRVTGKLVDTLAETAEKVIDKQAQKLTGDGEEEEDEDPPQR
jgi:hypothetical protein